MKLHWKILFMLVLGVVVGGVLRASLGHESAIPGATFEADRAMIADVESGSAAAKAKLKPGQEIHALIVTRKVSGDDGDEEAQVTIPISGAEQLRTEIAGLPNGVLVLLDVGDGDLRTVTVKLSADSDLDLWLRPFRFVATLFIKLLKMLIVPLILTSIITGVAGLGGGKNFGRLGSKTFAYYILTSLLSAAVGLALVNWMAPGVGAQLGLGPAEFATKDASWVDIFLRMIPENPFEAFSDNSNMLQVIFFSLLFGFFITQIAEPARTVMTDFFSGAFDVMMKLAGFALSLVPYGVFALMVKVIGETGYEVFVPLGYYMATVFIGLMIHAGVTLPMLVALIGKVNPYRWFKAMTPALLTAFSTSSSSMTLPVTIETVEKRGKVSNKTSSFVLPLGATINMDGTALYECIGVLFLAQYYDSVDPNFTLTVMDQFYVVFAALVASIGAAGIPSAGLVMMLTILSALDLPVEGAALLLAVDRPLDMCRTAVNVWSDTCGTAIVAASEGETLLEAVVADEGG